MSRSVDALTVIAVIDLLRAHPEGVELSELARRFQVPEEDMSEILWTIWTLGVRDETGYDDPVGMFDFDADAFADDWIVLTHDPVRTAPVRYTAAEQATVVLGLEVLRAGATDAEREHIDPLLANLRGGAAGSPAASWTDDPNDDALADAIRERRRVRLLYRPEEADGAEWRTVEPLRLENRGASTYLNAWCCRREGLRWFRLDRIQALEPTDDPADPHTEAERDRELAVAGRGLVKVELRVGAGARTAIEPYAAGRMPKPDAAGRIRVTVPLRSWRIAARLVGENAGEVVVLGPPEVRDAVHRWALDARASLIGPEQGAPDPAPGVDPA